jgi:hypothetical protein
VHQLALAWRPGKGTEDAPFLGGDPRAICDHPGQDLALTSALTLFSSLQFCFLKLNLSN